MSEQEKDCPVDERLCNARMEAMLNRFRGYVVGAATATTVILAVLEILLKFLR